MLPYRKPAHVEADPVPAKASEDVRSAAVAFLIGVGITWATYSANRAYSLIAFGPMLFGVVRVVQGLVAFRFGRSR
jgi:hypothetical protein